MAIRVEDVAPNGYTMDRATVRQKKTGRPVKFEKLRGLRLNNAAELVAAAIEETLAYYVFPEEHWPVLASA